MLIVDDELELLTTCRHSATLWYECLTAVDQRAGVALVIPAA